MTYKYNKNIVIHLIVTLVVSAIAYFFYDMLGGIIALSVFIIFGTISFNCYRIDIAEDNMTIYRIYWSPKKVLWEEVESVTIGEHKVERAALGSYRDMTLKFHEKKELVVNIEPVESENMISNIEQICKIKGISFSKE